MNKKKVIMGAILGLLLGSKAVSVNAEKETGENEKQLELHFDKTTKDSSKNQEKVKVVGNEQYVEGVSGQAFSFDGQTYLDLGTDEALQPENLTVSFWMKAEEPLQDENMLFWFKQDGNYAGEGWYLSCLSSDVPLKLSVGAVTENLPMEAFIKSDRTHFFESDTWHHIAVTFEGASKEVNFYKDGKFIHTEYVSDVRLPIAGTKDHKYIGFNSPGYGGAFCKLSLDEVTIYSKAMSKAEIETIYHKVYDPYHHSQVKAAIVKWGFIGILVLAAVAILLAGGRFFYQKLLTTVSTRVLEQANFVEEHKKEKETLEEQEEGVQQEEEINHSSTYEPSPKIVATMQEQVKEYIEENYKEKSMNLNMLGELFGVTPSYLSKQFRETYGISPIEELTRIRTQKAKELLLHTNKTVEQIADEVGYFSSSVFIRSFKKQEEMTPGMFRKQASSYLVNPSGNESS